MLPHGGAHTLAGLVFDALGRRPEPGERVVLGDRELTVREVDGARIAKLEIRPADAAGDDEEDEAR